MDRILSAMVNALLSTFFLFSMVHTIKFMFFYAIEKETSTFQRNWGVGHSGGNGVGGVNEEDGGMDGGLLFFFQF